MENSLHLKTKAIGSGRFTTVHLETKVRALENSLHLETKTTGSERFTTF